MRCLRPHHGHRELEPARPCGNRRADGGAGMRPTVAEFVAKRRGDQDELEKTLFPFVQQAMDAYPVEGWYNDLLQEVARDYLEVFRREGGRPPVKPSAAEFTDSLKPTLDKTE